VRTFIAIDLSQEIKKVLSQLIEELDEMDKEHKKIRWIKKEGMHLTIKFLGDIGNEKIPEIEKTLKNISEKFESFVLKLKGTGTFPPRSKNPRVLWIGIKEEETLKLLQHQMEADLEKLGFPRESRKFHPHLTLGRVKVFSNFRQILLLLEKYRERIFGEMKVEKITFFQSKLKPTGAEYSILSEFELK
jgi:2'-5' RNA ligase